MKEIWWESFRVTIQEQGSVWGLGGPGGGGGGGRYLVLAPYLDACRRMDEARGNRGLALSGATDRMRREGLKEEVLE